MSKSKQATIPFPIKIILSKQSLDFTGKYHTSKKCLSMYKKDKKCSIV